MSSDIVREKFEALKKELDGRAKVLQDDLQLKSRAEIDKLTEHAKQLVAFQKRVEAARDANAGGGRVSVNSEELRTLQVRKEENANQCTRFLFCLFPQLCWGVAPTAYKQLVALQKRVEAARDASTGGGRVSVSSENCPHYM